MGPPLIVVFHATAANMAPSADEVTANQFRFGAEVLTQVWQKQNSRMKSTASTSQQHRKRKLGFTEIGVDGTVAVIVGNPKTQHYYYCFQHPTQELIYGKG